MKKCPHCGEDNQDEAVICHYCWHELPMSVKPSLPGKTNRSAWGTGAIWAAIFIALAVIGAVIRYYFSPYNLFRSLAIGTIPGFLLGWPICTLITWFWRKAGNRRIIKGVIIYATILLCITAGAAAEFLIYKTQQLNALPPITPTETPTSQPTPVLLSNCYSWDTITLSQVGQTYCIYGKVSEFGGTVILFSRSSSQVRINYRPIGIYLSLHNGDCIVATGLITMENGILMLTTSEIDSCPAGFIP